MYSCDNSLLTLTVLYIHMRSVTLVKCYIILHTPMFSNILSNITHHMTERDFYIIPKGGKYIYYIYKWYIGTVIVHNVEVKWKP